MDFNIPRHSQILQTTLSIWATTGNRCGLTRTLSSHRGGNGKPSADITSGFFEQFHQAIKCQDRITHEILECSQSTTKVAAMQIHLTGHVQEIDDNRTTRHTP